MGNEERPGILRPAPVEISPSSQIEPETTVNEEINSDDNDEDETLSAYQRRKKERKAGGNFRPRQKRSSQQPTGKPTEQPIEEDELTEQPIQVSTEQPRDESTQPSEEATQEDGSPKRSSKSS